MLLSLLLFIFHSFLSAITTRAYLKPVMSEIYQQKPRSSPSYCLYAQVRQHQLYIMRLSKVGFLLDQCPVCPFISTGHLGVETAWQVLLYNIIFFFFLCLHSYVTVHILHYFSFKISHITSMIRLALLKRDGDLCFLLVESIKLLFSQLLRCMVRVQETITLQLV